MQNDANPSVIDKCTNKRNISKGDVQHVQQELYEISA